MTFDIDTWNQLKHKHKAVLIAHYYQEARIQDLADYVGDSYGMALFAQKSEAQTLIIAGVRFMAETAKVMNPEKRVLLPDLAAGCSLADSCTPPVFQHFRNKYPEAFVMTYINSSLAVKAMSDVICTSSNAERIIEKIPASRQILFGPDQHLGRYLMKKHKRDMILFPGNCFVHMSFSMREMLKLKALHPRAHVIAHPECEESILEHADFIGSTSQLLEYSQTSAADEFIVMTEAGILHKMKLSSPHKKFLAGPDLDGCACNECPHMKLNTMQKVMQCLESGVPELHIDPEMAEQARIPLNRMIEMSCYT
jgi:quinolinate synthase